MAQQQQQQQHYYDFEGQQQWSPPTGGKDERIATFSIGETVKEALGTLAQKQYDFEDRRCPLLSDEKNARVAALSISDASTVDENENDAGDERISRQTRQASCSGCGFDCDCYRRAVIVLDAIAMVAGMVFFLPSVYALASVAEMEDYNNNNNNNNNNGHNVLEGAIVGILSAANIACCACGIYGALEYRRWGVFLASISHLSTLLFGCCQLFSILVFPNVYKRASANFGNMVSDMDVDISAVDAADAFYEGMLIYDVGKIVLGGFFLLAHVKLLEFLKQGIVTPKN